MTNVIPFLAHTEERIDPWLLAAIEEVERTRAEYAAIKLATGLVDLLHRAQELTELLRDLKRDAEEYASNMRGTKDLVRHYTV